MAVEAIKTVRKSLGASRGNVWTPGRLQVQRRMDQAYQDKLDGKIGEDFWIRKASEGQTAEGEIRASKRTLEAPGPERLLDAARILELANKAHFLYLRQITLKEP